jgi:uncharacterized protein (DUF885 family)
MMLFTNRGGWHQNLAGLSENLVFRNAADYENYLKRLAQYPAYNDEALAISTRAMNEGYTLPCVAMTGFADTISGVIGDDPSKSRFYEPFAKDKPANIDAAAWASLQSPGTRASTHRIATRRRAYRRNPTAPLSTIIESAR